MLCKHPKRGRELFVHCPSGNMSKGCNKVSFESFKHEIQQGFTIRWVLKVFKHEIQQKFTMKLLLSHEILPAKYYKWVEKIQ